MHYDDSFDTEPAEPPKKVSRSIKSRKRNTGQKTVKRKNMSWWVKLTVFVILLFVTITCFPQALLYLSTNISISFSLLVVLSIIIREYIKKRTPTRKVYPTIVLFISIYILAMIIFTLLSSGGPYDSISGWAVFFYLLILSVWAIVMTIAGIIGLVTNLSKKCDKYNLIISLISIVLAIIIWLLSGRLFGFN